MSEQDANPTDEDNWLDGRAIACPSCQLPLWSVVHSPFYDGWFFYCDRCPKRAEVSFYDGEVKAIYDAFAEHGNVAFQSERMYREIERRLAPCDCGGQFKLQADRRCHQCHSVVLAGQDAHGRDLWPGWNGSNADYQPSPEEEKEMQEFNRAYIKSDRLWRHTP